MKTGVHLYLLPFFISSIVWPYKKEPYKVRPSLIDIHVKPP